MSSVSEEGVPEEEARINRGRERFVFDFNSENQLNFDMFIIDESSMVDVELGAAFLKAIPDGARLIIVGDHFQLPSVGPGSFLRDLMAAGVPSALLTRPRRNSGSIAHSCYLIKEGKNPNPRYNEGDGISNWTHIEILNDIDILNRILKIHIKYIEQNGIDAAKLNLQVISPEKKGILGCNNLNKLLGQIINPGDELVSNSKDEESEAIPRTGDKVVRTKNGYAKQMISVYISNDIIPDELYDLYRYDLKTTQFEGETFYIDECYLVNGDMGEVVGFKPGEVVVRFQNPDRLCLLSKLEAKISLAYALTVHKMQGSSSPIVISPLTNYYWNSKLNVGLFCRELVYTLLSRPSEPPCHGRSALTSFTEQSAASLFTSVKQGFQRS